MRREREALEQITAEAAEYVNKGMVKISPLTMGVT